MRAPSWSATAPAGRLLLVLAGIAALLAVGAFSAALRTPPTRITHTLAAIAPASPVPDAIGCPAGLSCQVRAELPGHVRDALLRAFPGASLVWQSSTVDAGTGAPYLVQAVAEPRPDVTLLLTARCVPGSRAVDPADQHNSAVQRSDLAGNQLALLTMRQLQQPGAPGCRLDVSLYAPGDGEDYADQLAGLARDPAAQVRS